VATSALGGRLGAAHVFGKSKRPSEFRRSKQTKNSFLDVRKTATMNRTNEILDALSFIQSERISNQWTNELRKHILVYPTCKILRALLSLDVYTQTVVYAFLIKGWSSSRIAEYLDVSVITIQELLENGQEQLKRTLG
jgi:DNA-directed RNA polymerase specialized sigma24 family protein